MPVHPPETTCLDEMYLQRLIHRRRLRAVYDLADWPEAEAQLMMWEVLIGERMKEIEARSYYEEPRQASTWAKDATDATP